MLHANPLHTVAAISQQVCQDCKITASRRTVGRWMRVLEYSRKKTYHTIDYTPPQSLIDNFCTAYTDTPDDDIISIDEAGFQVGDHARYGYSKRGQRIHIPASQTLRRRRLTLVLAVSNKGVFHYKLIDGSCKKQDFIEFIRELPPDTIRGKKLVMDNLRCHHSKETLDEIARLGCRPLFVPPYSPRYNAIECAFSALKRSYRLECSGIQGFPNCSMEDYADLVVTLLELADGFAGYFQHVRNSIADFYESGVFKRYD